MTLYEANWMSYTTRNRVFVENIYVFLKRGDFRVSNGFNLWTLNVFLMGESDPFRVCRFYIGIVIFRTLLLKMGLSI
nr:hypothetical protein [Oryctes rhinoceros nudivirus]UBR58441.1 hypothetical protein [Oryctes rhinoceros nudivirus]